MHSPGRQRELGGFQCMVEKIVPSLLGTSKYFGKEETYTEETAEPLSLKSTIFDG